MYDWKDYIGFDTKIEEDSGLAYVNYIGGQLNDIDAEKVKAFTKVRAGSYKPKRKIWMDNEGRMFEGGLFSQSETNAIVYSLEGHKFVLDKSQLSGGDRLFLERCQYGQEDMRDINSRPDQYLPSGR
ncbi:hypothetical protein [Cerasicoccus frondis]|uniref:hypothetical protein n=1 Tax=Cerasicoccus frondis TaxID=490090 RepID=UPI0028529937|nr:hypothetical protein [Cerasicoccus frondis]